MSDAEALFGREQILESAQEFRPPRGVYFLLDGDEIVYVGMSNGYSRTGVWSRLVQHRNKSAWEWDSFAIHEVYGEDRVRDLERRYIEELEPRYNRQYV